MKKEKELQKECFMWTWNERPESRGFVFSIENEHASRLARLSRVAAGILPGVADMCLLGIAPTWVELKIGKGKQSPAQKEFQNRVESLGQAYKLVYSFEEFQAVFNEHFKHLI